MVPRDEVGLWSILKHCIGKELSKITIPVVFNEPLSFLQRMAEIFEYTNYLNIADQCDDVIERMEVSGRLESPIVPSAPFSLSLMSCLSLPARPDTEKSS